MNVFKERNESEDLEEVLQRPKECGTLGSKEQVNPCLLLYAGPFLGFWGPKAMYLLGSI